MSQENTLMGFCPVSNPWISFTKKKKKKNKSEKWKFVKNEPDFFPVRNFPLRTLHILLLKNYPTNNRQIGR